jgi:hypothetical protein
MGLIGCGRKDDNAVTVSRSNASAPQPVSIVVVGNNGLVCNNDDKVRLVALATSTGTIRWFRDGVLQPVTSPDNEIDAGIGEWFAVVNDGEAWSTPSNTATVSLASDTDVALTPPEMNYGGNGYRQYRSPPFR